MSGPSYRVRTQVVSSGSERYHLKSRNSVTLFPLLLGNEIKVRKRLKKRRREVQDKDKKEIMYI